MTNNTLAKDVAQHKRAVSVFLSFLIGNLEDRAKTHDDSKLSPEEFNVYDQVGPSLKAAAFGSEEYKAGLAQLGSALAHHYATNRHHPEYFKPKNGKPGGIPAMDLVDVTEMLCDWVASALAKGNDPLKGMTEVLFPKYRVDGDLQAILSNTVKSLLEDVANQPDKKRSTTEGPWEAEMQDPTTCEHPTWEISPKDDPTQTICVLSSCQEGNLEATAKLIARAPVLEAENKALRESLREMVEDLEECGSLPGSDGHPYWRARVLLYGEEGRVPGNKGE